MADIKQGQQMIPLITCEIPFVKMSACWLLVSMYLIRILGVQINSIEQPIKSNSVGSGNVSHCRTFAFNDHLDHSFIVLKHIRESFLTRGLDI